MKKKIVTIVGARPQFVKAAAVSRVIYQKYSDLIDESIVHTGQHYDENMSSVFFEELKIPEPAVNLSVGSGTHGEMTGTMLIKIEKELQRIEPDWVIVYGDTNSTLAGSLAASKMHIPVAHIEAGLRSYNRRMPEEQNRVLTDHLADYLFCPTTTAVDNLLKEGISKNVHNVGDVMYDAHLFYRDLIKADPAIQTKRTYRLPDEYFLLTLHRAENTDDEHRLRQIVRGISDSGKAGVFPMHPRTEKALHRYGLSFGSNIQCIEPVSYLEMLDLESNANLIVTDSGGVQKEAYFHEKPCITLRDETEWIETLESGANTLVNADSAEIAEILKKSHECDFGTPYGNGTSSEQIIEILMSSRLTN